MIRVGSVVGVAVALLLVTGGCGAPAPATAPPSTPPSTPTPPPASAPPESAAPLPTPPPGTTLIDIPEAGIRLPVPDGWEAIGAEALTDPATRDAVAMRYPGSGKLLGALDQLGDRAEPVFLAADPSAVSPAGRLAPNLTVLVSQPSVGGLLLDMVAGFIGDALTDVLGATDEPAREKVMLPVGEAVHFRYAIPAGDGDGIAADAWVIGAPRGTLLVTLMGATSGLADLDPDSIAGAIAPLADGGS